MNTVKPKTGKWDFDSLVREFGPLLRVRALQWAWPDEHAAEDLVQETIYRAWKKLDTLEDPDLAWAWLVQILGRCYATWCKQQRRLPRSCDIFADGLEPTWHDRHAQVDTEEDDILIALRPQLQLPGAQGELLAAHYENGGHVPSVARALGKTQHQVRKATYRLRDKFLNDAGLGGWMRTCRAYVEDADEQYILPTPQLARVSVKPLASRCRYWSSVVQQTSERFRNKIGSDCSYADKCEATEKFMVSLVNWIELELLRRTHVTPDAALDLYCDVVMAQRIVGKDLANWIYGPEESPREDEDELELAKLVHNCLDPHIRRMQSLTAEAKVRMARLMKRGATFQKRTDQADGQHYS